MSPKLTALADRRRKLVQKISEQRTELSELMRQWQKPLAVADSGLKVIRVVRGHPAWLASGLAALLAWRLKGIAGTTQRGWPLAYLYSSAIFAGTKLLSTLVSPLMKKHDKAGDDSEDR